MANFGGIQLTTIAHPQEKLGEMAAELLLDIMQNGDSTEENRKILVEPEIVIGNSCIGKKRKR